MTIVIRHLGRGPYEEVFARMRTFNDRRTAATDDEFWLVEHEPVYTLGLNARRDHILDASAIPVVETDRGGQVTYHGPGQIVLYVLVDLVRRGWGVRRMVWTLEQSVINVLAGHRVDAVRRVGAPGVYVNNRKIAALGLRVRRGCSYHGVALNVDMDLTPYRHINPCGYAGLEITQTSAEGVAADRDCLAAELISALSVFFGLDDAQAPVTGTPVRHEFNVYDAEWTQSPAALNT